MKNSSVIDLAAISIIWVISIILVNPIGEFPINDDWSFALTTKKFYESGVFEPIGWAAMPQLTNTIWGAIFLLPKGFSFFALRISTLTISLVGVWSIYLTMVRIDCSRLISFAVACTFAFSPIYYPLSMTFMTDVLFVALVSVACYFYVLNLFNFTWKTYLIALIVIVGATLSRQLAIAVPLGFGIAFLLRYGTDLRLAILALIPFFICLLSYLILRNFLALNGKLPDLFDSSNSNFLLTISNPLVALRNLPNNLYVALMYFGLIFYPVLLHAPIFWGSSKQYLKKFMAVIFLLLLFGILRSVFHNLPFLMPITGNIFNITGLGPFLLNDSGSKSAILPSLPNFIRILITGIVMICAARIILDVYFIVQMTLEKSVISRRTKTLLSPKDGVTVFALMTTAACITPILLVGFFDRYLLSVLPTLIIILFISPEFSKENCRKQIATILLATLVVISSTAGAHDMLSWNRARWQGIDYLKKDLGAKDREIDGGFEFNGMCCYSSDYQAVNGKSWWWVEDDLYRIGFGIPEGYVLLKEFQYERWIPLGRGSIFVSKRAVINQIGSR